MVKAKLSLKGQVVIPAHFRKKYGITPGAIVEVIDAGDRIVLRPAPKDPVEEVMGILRGEASLTRELLRARKAERDIEEKSLVQAPLPDGE